MCVENLLRKCICFILVVILLMSLGVVSYADTTGEVVPESNTLNTVSIETPEGTTGEVVPKSDTLNIVSTDTTEGTLVKKPIQVSDNIDKPMFKVKYGIKTVNLSWTDVGTDGYEIWARVGSDGKSYLYKVVNSVDSVSVPRNVSKTYYWVRGFNSVDDTVVYSDFSSPISVVKPTITLKKNIKKVNGDTYSLVAHDRICLKWNRVEGATKYVIYRYNSSKKGYSEVKTVSSSYSAGTVTGLKSSTSYTFKVRAYDTSGNYIESNSLSVKTWSKTKGYFYSKCIFSDDWKNVLITTDKASNSKMASYTINGIKPAIKYNYSINNKTLYIHAYVKFLGTPDSKFTYMKKSKKGNWYVSSTSKYTYRSLIKSAIVDKWSRSVTGEYYDFMSGCNFTTKVILHESGYSSNQKVLKLHVGDSRCKDSNGRYWFTAGCFYVQNNVRNYYWYGDMDVTLPTQKQLSYNKISGYRPVSGIDSYKSSVAHEFGHALGLADAYDYTKGKTTIKRLVKNSETCHYINKKYKSIMYSSDNVKATDNDIEMAIQAQGYGVNEILGSYQGYKKNTVEGSTTYRSKVIRK